jgi:UDP:flavonoid glycosyltransferase YjiC (YdhE family)
MTDPALDSLRKPSGTAPPTVLLGWELGGGLGHIQRLMPLAQALAAHGCRPVLAGKNVVETWPALRDASFPILQAPLWQPRPGDGSQGFQAASYADILAIHGYAAVEDLAPMVQAWQGLIDVVQPALVVCDHSPTLCLAAYGALPTVVVGNGFTVPPVEEPTFQVLRPGRDLLVPEVELLAVVREVQRRRGRPAPATLPGLFASAERFLTVLPEMDPYQGFRQEVPIGPVETLTALAPPPAQPRYFAYLSADAAGLEQLLGGLARSGCPGSVYIRGATPALRGQWQGKGLEILDSPRRLADTLPGVSVVLHHGSVGLAQHALAAGRPQLTFPGHLEHLLYAQILYHRLGTGAYVIGPWTEDTVMQALKQVVGSRPLAERALARAADVQRRGPWDPLPRIIERCLVVLNQSGSPSSTPKRSLP